MSATSWKLLFCAFKTSDSTTNAEFLWRPVQLPVCHYLKYCWYLWFLFQFGFQTSKNAQIPHCLTCDSHKKAPAISFKSLRGMKSKLRLSVACANADLCLRPWADSPIYHSPQARWSSWLAAQSRRCRSKLLLGCSDLPIIKTTIASAATVINCRSLLQAIL